jgi:hypothetical protein
MERFATLIHKSMFQCNGLLFEKPGLPEFAIWHYPCGYWWQLYIVRKSISCIRLYGSMGEGGMVCLPQK